jgi:protein-S-isoprenylcysteine O-methyltransferase Ste14
VRGYYSRCHVRNSVPGAPCWLACEVTPSLAALRTSPIHSVRVPSAKAWLPANGSGQPLQSGSRHARFCQRSGVSNSTHSLAFRRNRGACSMPSLESRVPPPAVVLVIGVFMWLLSRAAPSLHFDVPARNWLAVVLVLAGFLTGISGVVTFLRAKTTVDPTKPRASSLVTWGVYAISRNPMYLGGLTMLLAQSRRGVGRCPCDHRPGHTGSVAIWRTSSPLRDDVRSIRFSACQSSRPLPASGSV